MFLLPIIIRSIPFLRACDVSGSYEIGVLSIKGPLASSFFQSPRLGLATFSPRLFHHPPPPSPLQLFFLLSSTTLLIPFSKPFFPFPRVFFFVFSPNSAKFLFFLDHPCASTLLARVASKTGAPVTTFSWLLDRRCFCSPTRTRDKVSPGFSLLLRI